MSLKAIRDRLAVEPKPPRREGWDAAAIAKELRATIAELDSLPGQEADPIDELPPGVRIGA